jgi:hypothetical protein
METSTDNLYKKTDFRMIKAIAIAMSSFEEKTKKQLMRDYDLNHIRCYYCVGNKLIGSSVIGFSSGTHFLAAGMEYEVYEIPAYSNKSGGVKNGKFMVLFRDAVFDEWMLASLNFTCGSVKQKDGSVLFDKFIEKAEYELISESTITKSKRKCIAYWSRSLESLKKKIPDSYANAEFDPLGTRMRNVYGISKQDAMRKCGIASL